LSVTAANYKALLGGRRVISGGIVLQWDEKEINHRVDDGALKGLIISIFVVFQKVVSYGVTTQWFIRSHGLKPKRNSTQPQSHEGFYGVKTSILGR
jgi:hypothetical protein